MKNSARIIMGIIVITTILLSCTFTSQDIHFIKELDIPQLYQDFLQGIVLADNGEYCIEKICSNGEKETEIKHSYVGIEDIFWRDEEESKFDNKMALFDMTGNGVPELHLKSPSLYYILTIKDNKLIVWKTLWNNDELLNNGTFLHTRYGGAPNHIDYIYYILDSNGEELYRIDFNVYDDDENGSYGESDIYLFDGIEISMEQWVSLTKRYFEIGSEKIEWIKMGNNNL